MTPKYFPGLRDRFHTLVESRVEGVDGVVIIDSGKPGPTIGINICTHANEAIAGVAVADQLMNTQLQLGRVIIACVDKEGATQFFDAKSQAERDDLRAIVWKGHIVNFNRLDINAITNDDHALYEHPTYKRVRELLPIWQQMDGSDGGLNLDIHTLSVHGPRMLLPYAMTKEMAKGIGGKLPRHAMLLDMFKFFSGAPILAMCGLEEEKIPGILIEIGQHEHDLTHEIARLFVTEILHTKGMIVDKHRHKPCRQASDHESQQTLFRVVEAIRAPRTVQILDHSIRPLCPLDNVTTIAREVAGEEELCLGQGNHYAMVPKPGSQVHSIEAVCFRCIPENTTPEVIINR